MDRDRYGFNPKPEESDMQGLEIAKDREPLIVSPHITQNIDRVLAAIRTYLKMDVAFVSEFLGANRIFRNVNAISDNAGVRRGDKVPMAEGYCRHVVEGRLPELIPDTAGVPAAQAIPATAAIPIGAHLSVPIRLDGKRIFGTLCCYSFKPQPWLGDDHLGLMRTFGNVIAEELTADLLADAKRKHKIETLQAAIAGGEPQIVFQPIVRLKDSTTAAVEALSRFKSEPYRSPDQWFADAHDVGMGPQLELIAARSALAECAALPGPLSVSINISPGTFITENVLEALGRFDPKRIIIEITEHVPIQNYTTIVDTLAPLRERGIRIAIDDAGAGYSSLRHVLALRPDIIKFDTSLTRNVHTDPTRSAMIEALSNFAIRTGTVVVAEGVESEEEVAVLRALGIEKAQGYYFGKPQTLSALLERS